MLAGCGKAGDYAGNPLLTVATQSIFWTNLGQTKMRAKWTAAASVDAGAHCPACRLVSNHLNISSTALERCRMFVGGRFFRVVKRSA